MKGTIKTISIIMMMGIMVILLSGSVSAKSNEDTPQNGSSNDDFKQQYEELLEESGANKLLDIIPDDAKSLLDKNDIDGFDADKLLNISFFDFIASVWDAVIEALSKPLTILLSCIGIILLCALLNSFKSGFNNSSYEKVFSAVSVICIASAIIVPIAQMITRTADVIKQVSNFLLGFIPVYVGILTASGKPLSAMAYSTSLIGVVQVISRIAASVLVPLLAIYLAFCLIGSSSSHINIGGIAKGVKTTVIVVLSFLLTIFVGLLTIQGIVATSSDSLGMKATKFAVSTFLPVVGSAISEALNSVQGCMGLIKSTVGGFGIVALVAAFLPSVITIVLMQLSLSISATVSEMLDTEKVTALLKSAGSVLSLLLGIMLVFFVLLSVSITIMLTLSTGG